MRFLRAVYVDPLFALSSANFLEALDSSVETLLTADWNVFFAAAIFLSIALLAFVTETLSEFMVLTVVTLAESLVTSAMLHVGVLFLAFPLIIDLYFLTSVSRLLNVDSMFFFAALILFKSPESLMLFAVSSSVFS